MSFIYLVHPKYENEPILACFTKMPKAQTWAEKSQWELDDLVCTKMVNNPDTTFIGTRVLCPWRK